MNKEMARAWSLVLGMSTMIVTASVIGIFRTNGTDGTHFQTLIPGIVVLVIALRSARKPRDA
ncbi:MAG: hypothetical protein ACO1SV_01045 [Fimbriimonas sp.]